MSHVPPFQIHAPSTVEPRPNLDVRPGEALEWTQPHPFRRVWELNHRGRRIVELRHEGYKGWMGIIRLRQDLVASSPSGRWNIHHHIWSGIVEIRREGEEAPAARFGSVGKILRRGSVRVAGGTEFRWRPRLRWFGPTTFELCSESDFPLIRIEGRRRFLRTEGIVRIEDAGVRLRDLEPLVLLSWVLVLITATHRSHAH